jgi:hypothetical protein
MDLIIAQSMVRTNQAVHNYNGNYVISRRRVDTLLKRTISRSQIKLDQDEENKNEPEKIETVEDLLSTANLKLNTIVNNMTVKKTVQTSVKLFLIFLKIGEIDNIKERFQAEAYIEAYWEDSSVDPKLGFDPRHNWDPELLIENAVGNLKQDIRYKVETHGDKIIVREMMSIKGLFWERLELWDFPLDIQELSISITTTRNKDEVFFESNPDYESTVNTEDFQQQQEWNLYDHIQTSKRFIHDMWNGYERPCYSVSCVISRHPGYFIYNAYMLIFFISILGFVPFSFTYTAPHFRIQTTCLLILSSVNFRWIVTQKLPSVSYLTTLDKYAIGR